MLPSQLALNLSRHFKILYFRDQQACKTAKVKLCLGLNTHLKIATKPFKTALLSTTHISEIEMQVCETCETVLTHDT